MSAYTIYRSQFALITPYCGNAITNLEQYTKCLAKSMTSGQESCQAGMDIIRFLNKNQTLVDLIFIHCQFERSHHTTLYITYNSHNWYAPFH